MKKRIILSVVLLTTIHANAFAQPFIVADGEVKMNQAYFASDAQANTDSDTTYVSPISDTNIESVQNTVDPSTDVVAENQDEASPISDTDPVFYFGPNGEIQFSSAANAPTIDEMVKTNKRNEDIVAEDKTDVVIPTISTGSGVKNSTGSIITPPEKKPEVKKQDTSTGATKKSVVTQGLFATEGATRKFYSIHTGADYRIRYRDMSVPFDSKVVFAGFEPGWGNVVGLKSKVGNIFLVLGHFNNFGKDIVPGADVKKGTYLGKTGNTGNTTGPHLHVELYKDGVPQDEYVQIRFLGDFFSGSDNPKLNPPEKWNTKHIRTMIAEAGLYSPMYAPFFDKIEAKEKETGVPERYLFSLRVASGKPIDEVADLLLTSGKFQPKIDDIKASKANVLSFVSCLNARYLMGYDFDCTLPRYKKGMDAFISSMDDLYTSQTTKVANVTNPVDNSKDVANSTPSVTLNGTKVVLDNPNPPKIEDNTPIRSDKKKNILSWIDSNVSDDKKLIGCYLKGNITPTDAVTGCRGNGIYLPPKKIWDIYKKNYDLSNVDEVENMLISMTHANLETSFDNNASAGEVNVKGDAKMPTGMYQLLYPDWGKKEDLLNPEWSVPVMKTQIHERQKKYGDNILYVFQKHYGFPKSGNFWYGKKYSSVFDFYIDTLVANGASDLKSIQEG